MPNIVFFTHLLCFLVFAVRRIELHSPYAMSHSGPVLFTYDNRISASSTQTGSDLTHDVGTLFKLHVYILMQKQNKQTKKKKTLRNIHYQT